MTQVERIKKHLEKGKAITAIEALEKFGCFRLAARISDLRNDGMNIKTTIVKTKNNSSIARYSVIK